MRRYLPYLVALALSGATVVVLHVNAIGKVRELRGMIRSLQDDVDGHREILERIHYFEGRQDLLAGKVWTLSASAAALSTYANATRLHQEFSATELQVFGLDINEYSTVTLYIKAESADVLRRFEQSLQAVDEGAVCNRSEYPLDPEVHICKATVR